ncbi:hypothetical protein [Roseateles koreensis]|uniref:Uncharacterized protein n=1 Tax=Roseateles koreensis TaxID=2987526 RepID=A0ABT5KLA5_9BURK|nr:hypothetical protein [Roseateles koreensis]MDC8783646.1 hypothetical protein [Roseateles koreensis]
MYLTLQRSGVRQGAGRWLALAVWMSATSSWAADSLGAETESAALKRQRNEIEARFATESQACETHFVVTSCLDDARKRRETAIRPLLDREETLATAERKAKALAQREAVLQRQRDFATQEGERRTESLRAPPPVASPPLRELRGPREATQDLRARDEAKATESAQRQQEAQARALQTQQRQQAMQAHEAQVRARNAERLKKLSDKPLTGKLPIPSPAELAAASRSGAPSAATAGTGASSAPATTPSGGAGPAKR